MSDLSPADAVAAAARAAFPDTVARLSDYLSYRAISCEPALASEVTRLAERIVADLSALGLSRARTLQLDGALPCVAAEWMAADPGAPTVLIYGHLDLQPVEPENWRTDPHAAVEIVGDAPDDRRLFARGAADDMGGWVSHLASIEAWLSVHGTLPCNVRLLIEGEEEIGSPNLERFMDAYPEAFEADVMVLTDCENPATDIPGLTVSLRGLLEVEVRCDAIESDVHSGLWGGVVPDASMALIKLLARLVDDDGRLAVGRMDVPEAWRTAAWDVPLSEAVIRGGAHLHEDVAPLPDRGRPPAEWIWRQPAVTILSTTLPTPDRRKNALRASAQATLSLRVAPGQTREALLSAIREVLDRDPPGGVRVTLRALPNGGDSWLYEPRGPAFEAADRAYQAAWGRPLLHIGVGGTIPFVALFGRRYGNLPLILNGVMDPQTSAHGPNESMHLGVFEHAIVANVYLLSELGALGRDALQAPTSPP